MKSWGGFELKASKVGRGEQVSKKFTCVQQHFKTHWFTDKEQNAAIE
jgi:hypothetical protein